MSFNCCAFVQLAPAVCATIYFEIRVLIQEVSMIEFDHVSMAYQLSEDLALKNVSFKVERGEFVFIIGSSGSGKSTIIKLLTCEERPLKGEIIVNGFSLNTIKKKQIPYLRRNIGMVFQDFRLIPSKTVFENVSYAMEIVGAGKRAILHQVPMVLSIVGLRNRQNAYPYELSGGEQQRVAIARAMVNKPMMILADEPTGNLDPANSESIMALLAEINKNGTTVLVCSHDKELVNRMKKRVILINDGMKIRDDANGGFYEQQDGQYTLPDGMAATPNLQSQPLAPVETPDNKQSMVSNLNAEQQTAAASAPLRAFVARAELSHDAASTVTSESTADLQSPVAATENSAARFNTVPSTSLAQAATPALQETDSVHKQPESAQEAPVPENKPERLHINRIDTASSQTVGATGATETLKAGIMSTPEITFKPTNNGTDEKQQESAGLRRPEIAVPTLKPFNRVEQTAQNVPATWTQRTEFEEETYRRQANEAGKETSAEHHNWLQSVKQTLYKDEVKYEEQAEAAAKAENSPSNLSAERIERWGKRRF